MKLKLKLLELNAYHFSESDGDELFIKIGKKRIWPTTTKYKKVKNNPIFIDTALDLTNTLETLKVELWEYDNIFSSECIGEFNLSPDAKGGPYIATMVRRSKTYASYALTWEVK
jgi:hypothetical protein